VRFAAQVFENPDHFNCDARIYDALDYLALNWYEYYCPSENFTHVVLDAQQKGCPVILTEFGSNATIDTEQASDFQRHLALFKSLGLTDYIGWMWRADYNLGNPDLPGAGYNLAKDVEGTPRPAFLLLQDPPQQTIYIRADGSVDPATAPIERDGDVYTLTGDINSIAEESAIIIERDNMILDGANQVLHGIGVESVNIHGVALEGRENVTIKNLKISAFMYCIYITSSSNILVYANNIINEGELGGVGIALWFSSNNNTILANKITNNFYYGISVDSSSYQNIISANNITNSYFYGMELGSSNNVVSENRISGNGYYGLRISASSNSIFHNTFEDNTLQVEIGSSGLVNVWDDGYPSGGNYWSDYAGADSDGDGIGDTPYTIDAATKTVIRLRLRGFHPQKLTWQCREMITPYTIDTRRRCRCMGKLEGPTHWRNDGKPRRGGLPRKTVLRRHRHRRPQHMVQPHEPQHRSLLRLDPARRRLQLSAHAGQQRNPPLLGRERIGQLHLLANLQH
jgi:parallel beta-helix repeat protein